MKLVTYIATRLTLLLLGVSLCHAQSPIAPAAPALSDSSAEVFSSASLAGSQLRPDPPESVEITEEAGYTREWITVQWRPGDPIYLYVVRPTKVKSPPVIIYLYGFPSETDIFRDDDWCVRVTAGGYAAVGFVPALTGHRYHNRPAKEWFVSELQESLAKSSHDVQMVLNYLATRGDLDMDRVGMLGEGAGGTIAVMAASADSRIKVVDLLNPWGDWPVWMAKSKIIPEEERANYTKPEFLQKIAAFDPVVVLSTLRTTRVRVAYFDDDFAGTPDESKKKIEAALPLRSEHRRFTSAKELGNDSEPYISDWLKQQLKLVR